MSKTFFFQEVAKEGMNYPSKEELSTLPLKAIVAYAARAADRSLQFYSDSYPRSELVAAAVQTAYAAANGSVSHATASAACQAARNAVLTVDRSPSNEVAFSACAAAANAADSAAQVQKSATAQAAEAAAKQSATAFADQACGFLPPVEDECAMADAECANAASVIDYASLSEYSAMFGWDDETLIDARILGPIWPNGRPEGVRQVSNTVSLKPIRLTLQLPRGANKYDLLNAIEESSERLNDLYMSVGGEGLTVDNLEVRLPVREPAGYDA